MVDPPYTLLGALYHVFRVQLAASATGQAAVSMGDYFVWGNDVVPTLLVMTANIVVYGVVVMFLEGRMSRPQAAPELDEDSTFCFAPLLL